MKRILNIIFIGILLAFLGIVSLQSSATSKKIEDINLASLIETPSSQVIKEPVIGIDELPFQDNMDIYQYDDPASIVTMYVTVRQGNPSDKTNYTWKEVNDFTKWLQNRHKIVDPVKAEAIVQIGDESGPLPGELGYGEVVTNATIGIRGASSTDAPPKSYKIELRSRAGEWRGQGTISLGKNKFDRSRLRSKLSFDLLKDIPNIVSLRTQFVHLYVKDETSDPPSQVFLDYGLFTQVEQPNRTYLRNHLLDPDGQLYKPNFFEFYRYPENIRLVDDPLYDEEAFVRIIEPKNTLDHSKLINMLEEVNDWSTPIEITFEKNFDADNYFTWLAFNILTGNVDTQSQNYYLYSPKNSEKWYFIPWDYDQAFTRTEREDGFRRVYDPFEEGVSNYWGGVLHNRVLRNDFYRNALDEKINELLLYMTPERIEGMLNEYRTVTDPFVLSMPDIFLLGVTPDEYEHIVTTLIPSEVQRNYELYLDSLDKPMPFYLGTPQKVDDILQFNWDPAYDFDGQDISYEFIVSKDLEFKEIVYDTDLADTVISIEMLEPGTYFWRVIATNEDGFSQLPFDTHFNAENDIAPGMKYLYISPDGQILETALEEIIVE